MVKKKRIVYFDRSLFTALSRQVRMLYFFFAKKNIAAHMVPSCQRSLVSLSRSSLSLALSACCSLQLWLCWTRFFYQKKTFLNLLYQHYHQAVGTNRVAAS